MNEPRKSRTKSAALAYMGYKSRRRQTFEQTSQAVTPWTPPNDTAAPDGSYTEAERIRPSREPSIESDVIVPFFQSLAAGFIALLLAGYAAIMTQGIVWHFACVAGMATTAIWFILAVGWARSTGWIKESIYTGNDTPQAAPIAAPIAAPPPMQLEITQRAESGNFRAMQRYNLPAELADKIPTFAAGIVGGRGLAVDTWTGSTGLFSRAEYAALMDALHQSGLVAWRNDNAKGQGRIMTVEGMAAMRQLEE